MSSVAGLPQTSRAQLEKGLIIYILSCGRDNPARTRFLRPTEAVPTQMDRGRQPGAEGAFQGALGPLRLLLGDCPPRVGTRPDLGPLPRGAPLGGRDADVPWAGRRRQAAGLPSDPADPHPSLRFWKCLWGRMGRLHFEKCSLWRKEHRPFNQLRVQTRRPTVITDGNRAVIEPPEAVSPSGCGRDAIFC